MTLAVNHERIEKRLEPVLLVATLLVLPVLILQASKVDEPWRTVAAVGDWVIWLVFLAEVLIMLAVVPNRWEWIRKHPLDLAIVVLTPPFAASLLQSVRALRLLRLLRLIRLAALARSVFSLDGVCKVADAVRGRFIYSGGIGSLDDLRALAKLRQVNLSGVIAGKSLYEKKFTVAEGQAALDGK